MPTITATFEDGVLKPAQPLNLPDHAQVRITIELMAEDVQKAERLAALITVVGADALNVRIHLPGMAAHDVRTLVSFDGGHTLGPFRGSFEAKSDSLLGYLAVKHRGYWADMFVTASSGPSEVGVRVRASLDAMAAAAGPGVAAVSLHALAIEHLGALPLHAVLSGRAL